MPAYDLMISAHPDDFELYALLKDGFEKRGLTLYAPDQRDATKDVKAIVNCKVFIIILSKSSAEDKMCQDITSLAYISNTQIFPIAIGSFESISPHLGFSLRLILAKINWDFMNDEDEFNSKFDAFFKEVKAEVDRALPSSLVDDTFNELKHEYQFGKIAQNNSSSQDRVDFWSRNFGSEANVEFTEFWSKFVSDYSKNLSLQFESKEMIWLKNLVYSDLFEQSDPVLRTVYAQFCGDLVQIEHGFYDRVVNYATGAMAMRKVFDMQSTVRLEAIRNLAQFQTPAVIASLMELVDDKDANMRAVAAISLSKVAPNNPRTVQKLMARLEDPDRLAREAAILSLGNMKCEKAAEKIISIWRNDPIAPVRFAAEKAMQQMELPSTKTSKKMVDLITKEIAELKIKKSDAEQT